MVPSTSLAVEDVDQARTLLKKMAQANREQDYQGIFTYEHAGALKSIRIMHLVRDGVEYERLLYLNGPRKEVVRKGVSPGCSQTDDRFLRGMPMPSEFASHIESHYELFLRGEDRVADRDVRIVHVVPKDDMRYGYILAIDKASGLLLQSLVVGTDRRVMERFQYVDISLEPDQEAASELLSGGPAPSEDCAVADSMASEEAIPWQAGWLPPGFELANVQLDAKDNVALSFTDGLSFVSVFIDEGSEARFPDIQAQRGATVAQLTNVSHGGKQYAVCVVGEIPPETAGKIARFVVPSQGP